MRRKNEDGDWEGQEEGENRYPSVATSSNDADFGARREGERAWESMVVLSLLLFGVGWGDVVTPTVHTLPIIPTISTKRRGCWSSIVRT